MSSYIHRVCKIAKSLNRPVSIQYDDITYKYLVCIDNVVYKENHLRRNINGIGFTLEDACYSFFMKCKGGELENYMTDLVIKIV